MAEERKESTRDGKTSSTPPSSRSKDNFFPDQPPYQTPTTGLLAWIHPTIHPFLQLMRLDRPKPSIYFYIPHLIGSIQAAILLKTSFEQLLQANLALLLGTFFLRGATCTWNDIVDIEFDKRVLRTRHRPLARGAISLPVANIFMLAQGVAALAVLTFMPAACALYAIPGALGWFIYPLAKRFTDYPQIILGFPMAWGVFMGAAAVGAEPLGLEKSTYEPVRDMANPSMSADAAQAIVNVYFANALWTLCYETVYSYQDVKDDVTAGVKNIALLLGLRRAKPFLTVVSTAEILLLFAAGEIMGVSWPYLLVTVVAHAAALATKISSVDLSKPSDCLWWFRDGGYITGSLLTGGFVLEYLRRAYLMAE